MYRTKQMQALRLMLVECFNQLDAGVPDVVFRPQKSMAGHNGGPVVYVSAVNEEVTGAFEDIGASKVRWFPKQSLMVDIYADNAPEYSRFVSAWLRSRQYRVYQARNNISAKVASVSMEPDSKGTSISQRVVMMFDVTIQDAEEFAIGGINKINVTTQGV